MATAAHAADPMPAPVQQELARQGLPAEALSVWIGPLDGPPVPAWALAADRIVNPASEMKLITTLAALDLLGPTYRWTTSMLSDARVERGELQGDLYLRGGGEPNLTWERLGSMLRALRDQGVSRIGGDLVLDRSRFEPARLDIGAPPFDDIPDAFYNVIPDALTVSDNLISYSLSSDATNTTVQTSPPLSGIIVDNRLTLNELPCSEWKDGWQAPSAENAADGSVRIVLTGSFPRQCKGSIALNTIERDLYLERLVRALWQELGGSWNGRLRSGTTPAGTGVLVERQFETLAETIRYVNKNSDAIKARLVYLTLGATGAAPAGTAGGQPTLVTARRRVLDWIAAQGVDPRGIVIDNGSGLSRIERFSTAQLASLLRTAAASPWYAEFASSLPIVALDGTMRNRMKGTDVAGMARLKTGTLRDVAALAGYVRDVRGRHWIVVAVVNHEQGDKGRPVLDQLLVWVAGGGAASHLVATAIRE